MCHFQCDFNVELIGRLRGIDFGIDDFVLVWLFSPCSLLRTVEDFGYVDIGYRTFCSFLNSFFKDELMWLCKLHGGRKCFLAGSDCVYRLACLLFCCLRWLLRSISRCFCTLSLSWRCDIVVVAKIECFCMLFVISFWTLYCLLWVRRSSWAMRLCGKLMLTLWLCRSFISLKWITSFLVETGCTCPVTRRLRWLGLMVSPGTDHTSHSQALLQVRVLVWYDLVYSQRSARALMLSIGGTFLSLFCFCSAWHRIWNWLDLELAWYCWEWVLTISICVFLPFSDICNWDWDRLDHLVPCRGVSFSLYGALFTS